MMALLEAMLLYKHKLLYDTYYYVLVFDDVSIIIRNSHCFQLYILNLISLKWQWNVLRASDTAYSSDI